MDEVAISRQMRREAVLKAKADGGFFTGSLIGWSHLHLNVRKTVERKLKKFHNSILEICNPDMVPVYDDLTHILDQIIDIL